MFNKRIMVRIENNAENAVRLAAAWGLVSCRKFAKFELREHHTVFYLTKKEAKELEDIVKSVGFYK
jgi:hypothetical protein